MVKFCNTCKARYELDPTNALITLYEDRTYMDNVLMVCEKGHQEILFFWEPEARDKFLQDHDELSVVREHTPEPGVIRCYETTFEIQLVKPAELSPRHLKLIAELAEMLDKTPDELLLEIFSHPPPRSNLPRRWT